MDNTNQFQQVSIACNYESHGIDHNVRVVYLLAGFRPRQLKKICLYTFQSLVKLMTVSTIITVSAYLMLT